MVAEDVLDSADPGDRRVHATLEPAVISGDPVLAERLVAPAQGTGIQATERPGVPG